MTDNPKPKRQAKRSPRHNARRFAVQALYQWEYNRTPLQELILEFIGEHDFKNTDESYFQELLKGTVDNMTQIEDAMRLVLDRAIGSLNPVELSVLRLAVYELMHRPDVPYRVVINEALELTKCFGSDQGFRYVNGVLDALGPKLRSVEAKPS